MKKRKQIMLTIVSGILLVLLGIFFRLATDYGDVVILTIINTGTIMIIIGAIGLNKKGISHDERTKKLSARAISHSWFITFIMLNILFWIDQLEILKLTLNQGIAILMPVMLMSAALLQWLYKRKGDIE